MCDLVFAREYELIPGACNFGKGDLIFIKEGKKETANEYAICQTKFIDLKSTGKTAQNARRRGRNKVKSQARFYFDKFLAKKLKENSVPVVANMYYYYYTNETKMPKRLGPKAITKPPF